MKTRRDARIWVYRDAVAASLRRHLHNPRFLPKGLTDAGVRRVQAEMEALAAKLEAKAARLTSEPETCEDSQEQSNQPLGESDGT